MRPARLLLLTAAAILFLIAAPNGPAPRFDSWRVIGPGGAGGMFHPAVSPHDPNLVFEICDMTGAYISHDSGLSWRMFNIRNGSSSFFFDPSNPKVIYAAGQALLRSEDTGRTWKILLPDPKRNTVQLARDDHASGGFTSDDPNYPKTPVRAMVVDPRNSKRLWLAFSGRRGNNSRSTLLTSDDGGASWKVVDGIDDPAVLLYYDKSLRVVTGSAVFTREEEHWRSVPGPAGAVITQASGGPGVLYANTGAALFMSRDTGKTWRALPDAVPGTAAFPALAASAMHPETAYVAYRKNGPRPSASGIAKTTDAGEHWSIVYESNGKSATNVEDAWIEDFYGGTGSILDLGVSPSNPDICFATDSCPRSFRTIDGGKSWRQVISQKTPEGRWATTGFDVTTCYGVHFDPFRSRTMFISYTDVGLFRSDDSGASWVSSIDGIPRRWQNTTYWVEFDPQVKGLMWGAFARTHDLPRPKMWQRNDPSTFGGGVGTSTDGGRHWTVTNAGMPETAVTHIVMDPTSPAGARTLYATGFGKGVYKSADNGKSWVLKNEGIDKPQPFAWRLTRARAGTLYLVVSRRNESGYKGDLEDGALYRSTDGAEHWTKMKLPNGVNGPNGLTLDPRDNKRMYLSAWATSMADGAAGGGVYLSTDSGLTWSNIFSDSQHVYDVTVDPHNPDVLYHSGFESGAWRSPDRGRTWTRIRGFNFKWGHRVIPDPVDAARIYITTFGGSVWHGPAKGDPRAVEDILNPIPIGH